MMFNAFGRSLPAPSQPPVVGGRMAGGPYGGGRAPLPARNAPPPSRSALAALPAGPGKATNGNLRPAQPPGRPPMSALRGGKGGPPVGLPTVRPAPQVGGPKFRAPPRKSLQQLEELFNIALEDLQNVACELNAEAGEVRLCFDRLMHARFDLRQYYEQNQGAAAAAAAQAKGGKEQMHIHGEELENRRAQLLVFVTDLVNEKGGEMKMTELGSNPDIQQMRQGVCSSLSKFLAKFPETFESLTLSPEETGEKTNMHVVRVIGQLPAEVLDRAEGNVQPAEGEAMSKSKRKRMKQQEKKAAEETGAAPEDGAPPAKKPKKEAPQLTEEEKEDRKFQLVDRITELISASEERAVRLGILGTDPVVQELKLGITKSLKAFVESQADRLMVGVPPGAEDGKTPDVVVTLVE